VATSYVIQAKKSSRDGVQEASAFEITRYAMIT